MKNNRRKIITLILSISIIVIAIVIGSFFVMKDKIKLSSVNVKQKLLADSEKISTVKILCVDTEGNVLSENSITGNIGEWYTTSRKSIESYSAFGDEPLNKNGYFEENESVVTYIYEKNNTVNTTVDKDNQVYVDINNHKSIREYQMIIKSISTDNGETVNLDGAQYKISKDSDEIKTGITSNGNLYVGTITVRNEIETIYTIEEINNVEGYVKKVKNPFNVKVIKKWNNDLKKYEATLEYDNSIDGVIVELNEDDEIIVAFDHSRITGKYSMSILNIDETTGEKISGAEFKVTKSSDDFIKEVKVVSGIANVGEFEVSKETNNTETYYIEQINPADGYNTMLDKSFEVQVTKVYDDENGLYKIELAYDRSIANVTAKLNEDNEIVISVTSAKENKEYDLAIEYFITNVDEEDKSRAPTSNVDENGNVTFTENKDIVNVANNQFVTLEARLYNTKLEDSTGSSIKIDIPNGFVFDETNEINVNYNWKMYEENENGLLVQTSDSSEAKYIISDYLDGKEIAGFNYENLETPNYELVKVVFVIDEGNLASDRKITNTAEIIGDSNDINTNNNKNSEHLYVNYFDLNVEKFIQTVEVTTNGVTNKKEIGIDKKNELVKIDIASSKIESTSLSIVYGLKVSNIGEISGRALEVVDYMPDGFSFNEEKNPDWYLDGNTLKTTILNNEILEPGESKIIYVTLDWNVTKDSMGKKVNNAEISVYYNEYNSEDITNDNTDSEEILVTVKTGAVTYATVVLVILGIVFILVLVKNKVTKEGSGKHGK